MMVPTHSSPFEFDMLLLEPVHAMMQTGIRIDQERLLEHRERLQAKWESAQTNLNIVAGRDLNVSSSKQMQEVLYDELGMRVRRNNKRPTANEDALRSIMAEARNKIDTLTTESAKTRWKRAYAVTRLALNIRSYRVLIERYLDIDYDVDGRIRSTISVGGTKTARFSHSKTLWGTGLNIATIPKDLRDMFIADDGYVFVEIDLNRGESWIYAHLSEDPEMLRIHREGLDFHAETAATISTVFGQPVTYDWVVANKNGEAFDIRYLGKRINHASAYREGPNVGTASVNKDADETGITITVAQFKSALDLWLQKYFMIEASWWPAIERQLNENRTMTTPYGRSCQFHDRWGKSLFNQATAYVPQSTSVDYFNRGMLRVYHLFQKTGAWGLKLLTQTHDSILFQVEEDHVAEAIGEVSQELVSTLRINDREFTIPVEASWGQNWGTLKAE